MGCGLRLGGSASPSGMGVMVIKSLSPDSEGLLYEVEAMGYHGRCGKGAFRGRSG